MKNQSDLTLTCGHTVYVIMYTLCWHRYKSILLAEVHSVHVGHLDKSISLMIMIMIIISA